MRYSTEFPTEKLASHASDHMLIFSALLAVLIGCELIYLGKRGKQMWMVWWAIGLIASSFLMMVAIYTGWPNT